MNKLIQTIVLTAIVFSPLSLISLITSAAAHHTPSHVSTVSIETTIARKKKKNNIRRTGKKRTTTGMSQKKPATTDATTQPATDMPSGVDSPMKITKPDPALPSSKVNPIDPTIDGTMSKPGTVIKVPTEVPSVTTSLPSGVVNPTGIPSVKPSLPTLPTGLPK